jgi:hypothetical protein
MVRRVHFSFFLTVFLLVALLVTIPGNLRAQYATLGPNGGVVLLTAPGVALPSAPAQPKAGISLADKTGISNNAPATSEVITVGSGGAVYNGGAPGNGTAVYNGSVLGVSSVPDGVKENQPAAPSGRRDWGNSVFVGEGPVGGTAKASAGTPTLAEIATKYKTSPRKSKRTYTNADAQRINDNQQMKTIHINAQPPQPR